MSRAAARGAATATALGLIAVALVGPDGGEPAQAAPISLELTYSCVFPVIGKKDLKVRITTDIPAKLPVDVAMPRIRIDTVASISEDTTNGLLSLGADTMQGGAIAYARMTVPEFPNGIRLKVGAKLDKTVIPPAGPADIIAKGSTIGPTFVQPGTGEITIGDLLLRPDLRAKDGGPTDLGEDFEVLCSQSPGQNNVLARFAISGEKDTKAPGRPGRPEITKLRAKSVALTWTASSDDVEVAGYDVYDGDGIVPGAKVTGTSAVVSGLTPETGYKLTVRARDLSGNVSEPSDPVSFRTPKYVPDTEAPTAPGGLKVLSGAASDAVRLGWTAADDNEEVTGYQIRSGGDVVATAPGDAADVWVRGLKPGAKYVFTATAKDEAGNVSPPSAPLTVQMPSGPPASCGDLKRDGFKNHGCVYMAGFSNIGKLKAATEINAPGKGTVLTNVAYKVAHDAGKKVTVTTVKFAMEKPLRSRSTFLTLGVMPTTGTVSLTQAGDGTLTAISPDGGTTTVSGSVAMNIGLSDVTVNGAALALGPNCRTSEPVRIALKGTSEYTDPLLGGPLAAEIPIPSFTGCGSSREDLSRLLTTLISSPKNLLKITQGKVCRPSTGDCAPIEPKR